MKFDPYSLYFLIDNHGQAATLTHQATAGTYNPATGTTSGGTATTHVVKGYFYNYKLEEIDGTQITKGDRKFLIKTNDTSNVAIPEPKVNDTISGVGDTVSVKGVDKIYSGSSVVVYILQVGE